MRKLFILLIMTGLITPVFAEEIASADDIESKCVQEAQESGATNVDEFIDACISKATQSE